MIAIKHFAGDYLDMCVCVRCAWFVICSGIRLAVVRTACDGNEDDFALLDPRAGLLYSAKSMYPTGHAHCLWMNVLSCVRADAIRKRNETHMTASVITVIVDHACQSNCGLL